MKKLNLEKKTRFFKKITSINVCVNSLFIIYFFCVYYTYVFWWKKTVKINPNLFSVSGKTKKRGKKSSARKKREKPSNHSKTSKKMRKEFFFKKLGFSR